MKKAGGLPVDQVAVLRIFPSGDAPTAVVTFYGTDGKVLSALTAQRGTALAEKAGAPSTGRGVSTEAAAAVTEVAKSVPPADDPSEEYETSFIGFDDVAVVNAQSGAVMSTWTVPYQGKFKKPLQGEAFYETVGRPDLVEQYQQRSATRSTLFVVGGVGILAGTAVMLVPLLFDEECSFDLPADRYSACADRQSANMSTGLLAGGGLMGAGAIVFLVGSAYNPHPVTPSQARELADEYNKRLKTRLSLAAGEGEAKRQGSGFTLAVSGALGRDGGGVLLSGTF